MITKACAPRNAQGELLNNDDTTMVVLELVAENKKRKRETPMGGGGKEAANRHLHDRSWNGEVATRTEPPTATPGSSRLAQT